MGQACSQDSHLSENIHRVSENDKFSSLTPCKIRKSNMGEGMTENLSKTTSLSSISSNPIHRGSVLGLASSRYLNTATITADPDSDSDVAPADQDTAMSRVNSSNSYDVFSCSDDKNIARVTQWNPSFASSSSSSSTPATVLFKGHTKAVNRITLDARHNCLWSVSRDLSVKQWNLRNGQCMQSFDNAHELNLSSIAIDENNGDGNTVWSGSRDYSVKQWDVTTGKCVSIYSCPRNIVTAMTVGTSCSTSSSSLSSTGTYTNTGSGASPLIYQASEDLKIRIWDPRKGSGTGTSTGIGMFKSPALEIGGFVYFALCLDLHRDGLLLATGCKGFNNVGCEVKVWDLRYTGRGPIHDYIGHSQDVTACKYVYSDSSSFANADASRSAQLVSCCKDGTIRVWNNNNSESSPTFASTSDVNGNINGNGNKNNSNSSIVFQSTKIYTSITQVYNSCATSATVIATTMSKDANANANANGHANYTPMQFCVGCFDGSIQRFALDLVIGTETEAKAEEDQLELKLLDCTTPYFKDEEVDLDEE